MRSNHIGTVVTLELRLSIFEGISVDFCLIFNEQVHINRRVSHIFDSYFLALNISHFCCELQLQLVNLKLLI